MTILSGSAMAQTITPTPQEQQAVAFLQQDEAWFIANLKGPREMSEGTQLDPRLQYVLETVTRPASNPAVIAQMRTIYGTEAGRSATRTAIDRYWNLRTAAVSEGVSTRNQTLPTRDGTISVRIYTPDGITPPKPGLPVLIYYHGGGFMFGSIEAFDPSVRRMAVEARAIVVSVGYRLAPEHPYPAAHNDAEDAYLWVRQNTKSFGGDPKKIGLGGDSAGGTLAISVALRQIKAKKPVPAGLLLYYPGVDRVSIYPSNTEFATGYGLDADNLNYLTKQVYPDPAATTSEDTSPMQADLCGLPPTVIASGGFDPLRDSNRAFVAKLKTSGTPVQSFHYPTLIHAYLQTSAYVTAASVGTTEPARAFGFLLNAKPAKTQKCSAD